MHAACDTCCLDGISLSLFKICTAAEPEVLILLEAMCGSSNAVREEKVSKDVLHCRSCANTNGVFFVMKHKIKQAHNQRNQKLNCSQSSVQVLSIPIKYESLDMMHVNLAEQKAHRRKWQLQHRMLSIPSLCVQNSAEFLLPFQQLHSPK